VRDPEVEACLRQTAQARERLGAVLREAKGTFSGNPLDWREQVRRHPVECTLGAVVAGFFLAGRSRAGEEATLLDDLSRTGLETALGLFLKSLL